MKNLSRLTKVSLLLAVLFTVDKALGILRQMLIGRQFGLSAEYDVFNAANNVPDMLFMLISGGALAIAFIPVLSEVLTLEGREKAWRVFSHVLNLAFVLTALIAIVVAIFARPLVSSRIGIAPGFTPQQIELTVQLLRLNLIATLIFAVSGLVMSGLQANQHFLFPALAPIFFDFGQIFGALVLAPTEPYRFGPITLPAFGLGVRGLVYGEIIGALLHLLIQVPGLVKHKFRWNPGFGLKTREVKSVLRLMGPRVISMFFIQLVFIMRDNFASRLNPGSVSALTYGYWIMQVPETLIGTAIATAILPTLAELASGNKLAELREKVEKAGRSMLALTIPIAIIAGIVLYPFVQRLLGMDPIDTQRVTDVSRVFLLGIIGHSLVEVFVRTFYALQNPKYPLIGAAGVFVLFVGFAAIFWQPLQAAGIALADGLAFAIQAAFLYVVLNKTLRERILLLPAFLRGVAGALAGGAVAFLAMRFLPSIGGGLVTALLAFVLGIGVAALLVLKDLRELVSL